MPNNPETIKEYARTHKELIRKSAKKYRDNNKQKQQSYSKLYRERNKEAIKIKAKERYKNSKKQKMDYQRKLTREYKQAFLDMYGGKCACCGESLFDFLTIEHRQGQQKITRRTGLVAYRDSVKEYRPDLYEVLCWNCNCAKGKLGYCPHNPPETAIPYKIHRTDKYNYTKDVDSLGRRYK